MRAAPAVSVRASRAGAWRGLQALLCALAAAATAAWVLGHLQQTAWPALAAGAVAGVLAWWLAPERAVDLSWDGQRWSAGGAAGRLDVMLDLGPWMLLRLQPVAEPRAPVWIPIAAAEAGAAWHALRAAAYGHAPVNPGQAGGAA